MTCFQPSGSAFFEDMEEQNRETQTTLYSSLKGIRKKRTHHDHGGGGSRPFSHL